MLKVKQAVERDMLQGGLDRRLRTDSWILSTIDSSGDMIVVDRWQSRGSTRCQT